MCLTSKLFYMSRFYIFYHFLLSDPTDRDTSNSGDWYRSQFGFSLCPLLFDASTPININDYLRFAAFYIQYSRKITFYYIKKELFFFLPLKKVKKVKLCLNWKMMLNLRMHSITSVLPVKRSVSVNPGNNGNVQFTTVSLKALSDQIWIWYPGFSSFKLFNFICGFSSPVCVYKKHSGDII